MHYCLFLLLCVFVCVRARRCVCVKVGVYVCMHEYADGGHRSMLNVLFTYSLTHFLRQDLS